MGPGRPREFEEAPEPKELDHKMAVRLEMALAKLDERNPEFGESRAEERRVQGIKIWGRTTKHMEDDLRALGEVLNASNQLSLDMGIEGGAANATPWIGETNQVIPRLEFKMDAMKVTAYTSGRPLGSTHVKKVDYEWVEKMCVTWLIVQAEQR